MQHRKLSLQPLKVSYYVHQWSTHAFPFSGSFMDPIIVSWFLSKSVPITPSITTPNADKTVQKYAFPDLWELAWFWFFPITYCDYRLHPGQCGVLVIMWCASFKGRVTRFLVQEPELRRNRRRGFLLKVPRWRQRFRARSCFTPIIFVISISQVSFPLF